MELRVTGGLTVAGSVAVTGGNSINTGSSSGNLRVQGGATYPGGAVRLYGGTTSEVNQIQFFAGTDTSLEQRMVITRTGDVGIGTDSPVSKLHLSGNLTIDNASNAPYIDFVENGDTGDSKARISMDQINGTTGQLLFYTEGSGTLSERMRIDSSGHVRFGSSGDGFDSAWADSTYGNTEVAIDGGGGYGCFT